MLKIDVSWDSTEKAIIILPPLGIIHLVHDSGRAYYGLEILKGQYIGVSDCNVFFVYIYWDHDIKCQLAPRCTGP